MQTSWFSYNKAHQNIFKTLSVGASLTLTSVMELYVDLAM